MPIDVPDVDKFGSTADRKIKVWSTPRFLACVDLIAKIDLPPDAAWRLLTHEGNAKAFRSIKVRCCIRGCVLQHVWCLVCHALFKAG